MRSSSIEAAGWAAGCHGLFFFFFFFFFPSAERPERVDLLLDAAGIQRVRTGYWEGSANPSARASRLRAPRFWGS